MKVLSTSPDAAVRRLRGFAASIGGKAELIPPAAFDPTSLAKETPEKTLLIIDATSVDGQLILRELPAILPDCVIVFALIPGETRDCPAWTADRRITGTLVGGAITSLESASIRCALGKILNTGCAPDASTFLRWGYASSLWTPARKTTIVEAAADFMDRMGLFGHSKVAHSSLIHELVELTNQAQGNSSLVSAMIATDGINCLSSVTLKNCNHLFESGLPDSLAKIDSGCGTILSLLHTSEITEISLIRAINGQTRSDGKSPVARPASYIRLINPASLADVAPNVRIVWTEAG